MKYDVIIVGAGPAGASTALALKNTNLKVALIDKQQFPRDKACGDAIPGQTFIALAKLNPKYAEAIKSFKKKQSIKKTLFVNWNGKSTSKTWKHFTYNSTRTDFDAELLKLALEENKKIDFLPETKIKQVSYVAEGISCLTDKKNELTAGLIIGCDGAHSIVKKELLKTKTDLKIEMNCTAVRQYYTGLKHTKSEQNEVYLTKKYPSGYFWIFPLKNDISNVGFGIENNSGVNVRAAFEELLKSDKVLAPLFKNATPLGRVIGAPLPLGGSDNQIIGNRFLLCGDAASLVAPISGSGIDNAVYSGIMAAKQVNSCFKQARFDSDVMKPYQDEVHGTLTKTMRSNKTKMKIITMYPWLMNWLIGILHRFKFGN